MLPAPLPDRFLRCWKILDIILLQRVCHYSSHRRWRTRPRPTPHQPLHIAALHVAIHIDHKQPRRRMPPPTHTSLAADHEHHSPPGVATRKPRILQLPLLAVSRRLVPHDSDTHTVARRTVPGNALVACVVKYSHMALGSHCPPLALARVCRRCTHARRGRFGGGGGGGATGGAQTGLAVPLHACHHHPDAQTRSDAPSAATSKSSQRLPTSTSSKLHTRGTKHSASIEPDTALAASESSMLLLPLIDLWTTALCIV